MNFLKTNLACALLLSTAWVAAEDAQTQIQDSNSNITCGITGQERLEWVVKGTVGPQSLATGLFTAAIQTGQNRPREYGPHWDGFGKRYGLRLTGIATERAMEAGLGALWGEDPRYFRAEDHTFHGRFKHVIVMTVAARRTDGDLAAAYARFVAEPASNFLSNTWRPDSIANPTDALGRTAFAFAGRLAGNSFAEFWPDLKKRIFHRRKGFDAEEPNHRTSLP
jgi:hypothetical protein